MISPADIVDYFESLTLQDLDRLDAYYVEEAYFRDPFNEVTGVAHIRSIFTHMFDALLEPRFLIRERIAQGDRLVLTWDFEFRIKRFRPAVVQRIHGLSLLRLAPDGRILWHRDYWDAAGELFEKLPVIGTLLRWVKRRMG